MEPLRLHSLDLNPMVLLSFSLHATGSQNGETEMPHRLAKHFGASTFF